MDRACSGQFKFAAWNTWLTGSLRSPLCLPANLPRGVVSFSVGLVCLNPGFDIRKPTTWRKTPSPLTWPLSVIKTYILFYFLLISTLPLISQFVRNSGGKECCYLLSSLRDLSKLQLSLSLASIWALADHKC